MEILYLSRSIRPSTILRALWPRRRSTRRPPSRPWTPWRAWATPTPRTASVWPSTTGAASGRNAWPGGGRPCGISSCSCPWTLRSWPRSFGRKKPCGSFITLSSGTLGFVPASSQRVNGENPGTKFPQWIIKQVRRVNFFNQVHYKV